MRQSAEFCGENASSDRANPPRVAGSPDLVFLGLLSSHQLSPAFWASIRLQDFLAQTQRLGSDLDKLIVGDELDRLLEVQRFVRDKADGIVSG